MIKRLRHSPAYPLLLKLWLGFHKTLIWLMWQLCFLLPADRHKVIFSNFNGGGFGDNPKYVAEACIRRKLPLKLYWVAADPEKGGPYPAELTLIRPNTLSFVYHMATARFWVDNTRKLYYFKKKKICCATKMLP